MEFIEQITGSTISIRQVVHLLQQYFEHVFPLIRLSSFENNEKLILSVESSLPDGCVKRHLLDGTMGFLYRGFGLMIGKDSAFHLGLPTHLMGVYPRNLRIPIEENEKYCFIFSRDLVEQEINLTRKHDLPILLPAFLEMIVGQKEHDLPFTAKVQKKMLALCDPDLPSMESVIEHFPLSNWTFVRKLSREGNSCRKISNGIKREMARYLVKGYQTKTIHIASFLGYSPSSSYLHARKKWHKASPS